MVVCALFACCGTSEFPELRIPLMFLEPSIQNCSFVDENIGVRSSPWKWIALYYEKPIDKRFELLAIISTET
jgi:hypothetical protein